MNQQATALVQEIQRAATLALQQAGNLNGLVGKFYTPGIGADFIAPHFLTEEGNPRVDLGGISQNDIVVIIEALAEVAPVLNKHIAKFVKVAI